MKDIIDFVVGEPKSEHLFAWKFQHEKYQETNLSTYSQLVVAESQEAILFSKGRIIGKFGPGKHTLNTENLPLLRDLYGIPFQGGKSFYSRGMVCK